MYASTLITGRSSWVRTVLVWFRSYSIFYRRAIKSVIDKFNRLPLTRSGSNFKLDPYFLRTPNYNLQMPFVLRKERYSLADDLSNPLQWVLHSILPVVYYPFPLYGLPLLNTRVSTRGIEPLGPQFPFSKVHRWISTFEGCSCCIYWRRAWWHQTCLGIWVWTQWLYRPLSYHYAEVPRLYSSPGLCHYTNVLTEKQGWFFHPMPPESVWFVTPFAKTSCQACNHRVLTRAIFQVRPSGLLEPQRAPYVDFPNSENDLHHLDLYLTITTRTKAVEFSEVSYFSNCTLCERNINTSRVPFWW